MLSNRANIGITINITNAKCAQTRQVRLTLYVANSVSLLKANVAMTCCNSFMWVAPHGARYFLAYVMARRLFSARTNSMNS